MNISFGQFLFLIVFIFLLFGDVSKLVKSVQTTLSKWQQKK